MKRPTLPLALCVVLCAWVPPADAKRPNFLLILCDDLGYGDLGCYGGELVQTPRVDRLAAEGTRFTDCYAAAANCSPARTGLMTGRTPHRVGIHNWIPMHSPMHVSRDEVTIATLLRDAGYDTCHAGKWHLNGKFNHPDQPQPGDHGFRHWFATQNNALPNHRNPDNFVRNGREVGRLEGYSAALVAGEAIRWLSTGRDRDRPFFLFVCFHEPHEPIATDPRFTERYREISGGNASFMAHHGNITQLDAACGELLDALDHLGLRDDTLVFFTSDNGPAVTGRHPHGSAGPLRDKKGSLYEGGIRVPGILRWPGVARPGSVSSEPVSGVDVLPTFCRIAGIPVPDRRPLDGADFRPALRGEPVHRSAPLYWHFYRARGGPKVAMRVGGWKILAGFDVPDAPPGADLTAAEHRLLKTAVLDGFELYELGQDPGERNDLSASRPEKLAALRALLEPRYLEVRAESPLWPEWKWPRYEAQRIKWPDYKGEPLNR